MLCCTFSFPVGKPTVEGSLCLFVAEFFPALPPQRGLRVIFVCAWRFVCFSPALSVIADSHAKHVPFNSARLYRPRGWKQSSTRARVPVWCMASCASTASACRCCTRGYCNKNPPTPPKANRWVAGSLTRPTLCGRLPPPADSYAKRASVLSIRLQAQLCEHVCAEKSLAVSADCKLIAIYEAVGSL